MIQALRSFAIKSGLSSAPDFIIIGTQKGGTSALYAMLDASKSFNAALIKEVHYFDNDNWYNPEKIEEYHACFPLRPAVRSGSLVFEATPSYLYHPEVAERLKKYNASLKLVILLRDPAERALSAWTMYHHHFRSGSHSNLHDPRTFREVVASELQNASTDTFHTNPKGYFSRGLYYQQIKRYLSHFAPEQLCILENKSIMNPEAGGINKLFRFLGKEKAQISFIKANESRVDQKIEYNRELNMLREFYKPHNEQLFELIGQRFNWG